MFKIKIEQSKCDLCKACIDVCPENRIYLHEDKIIFREKHCIECKHCFAVCKSNAIHVDEKSNKGQKSTKLNPITKFLQNRRSVHVFNKINIEDELIEKILYVGMYSPYHKKNNLKYIVMRDEALPSLKIGVYSFLKKLLLLTKNKLYKNILSFFSKSEDSFYYEKEFLNIVSDAINNENDTIFNNASCAVIIYSLRNKLYSSEEAWMRAYQICLSAKSYGIDTRLDYLVPAGINKNYKLKNAIGLDKRCRVHSCILFGKSKHEYVNPVKRDEPDIVFY